ncbi:DNA-deoxyinosine glycosylase [Novosphingobium sp.]|uniref:DNA-deoxyinosine glycosylase n=1 Tax=Novosphingobium sp. TaxID=1874826 RepID=UPI00286E051D|nr:DNA-deoxyinosine glycosylase [Novosphingobium sp.]
MADAGTRILVLGSLPGAQSLTRQQYYGNPRNGFWYLIGEVIGRPDLPAQCYAERLQLLTGAGIGLWDTIASAHRKGSLDTAIRDAEPAALAELAEGLPSLCAIAFNGAKSAAIGRKALGACPWHLIDLPSSSPAHAAMPLAEKREHWLALRDFLAAPLELPGQRP